MTLKMVAFKAPEVLVQKFQQYSKKNHTTLSALLRSYMQSKVDDPFAPVTAHLHVLKNVFQKVEKGEKVTNSEIVQVAQILGIKIDTLNTLIRGKS